MPGTISGITARELAVRVGVNLRRIRDERHLSVDELAKRCQCHRDTLRFYEGGQRTRFEGLVLLLRACRVLGVRIQDLVGEN